MPGFGPERWHCRDRPLAGRCNGRGPRSCTHARRTGTLRRDWRASPGLLRRPAERPDLSAGRDTSADHDSGNRWRSLAAIPLTRIVVPVPAAPAATPRGGRQQAVRAGLRAFSPHRASPIRFRPQRTKEEDCGEKDSESSAHARGHGVHGRGAGGGGRARRWRRTSHRSSTCCAQQQPTTARWTATSACCRSGSPPRRTATPRRSR